MKKKMTLLKTSIELEREVGDNTTSYYKLIIGTDPETRTVITDSNLQSILNDLPNILSTVINSQVLVETTQN